MTRSTGSPRRAWVTLLLGVGPLLTGTAHAEDVPYAAIRFERELGQVEVTTGYIDRAPDMQSRAGSMEKSGIVLLETDEDRTFTRTLSVGSKVVNVAISIAPPVGHGEGGGSSRALIRVVMGRDTLVDCPVFNGPMGLDRLIIDPDRRFVSVSASEGILHFDGFESRRVVDEDWLDEKAELTRKLLCGSK